MNWYVYALSKYTVFAGRACRSEYWFFVFFNVMILCLLLLVDSLLGLKGLLSISTIYQLLIFIPSYAVLARRLHDVGCSAWWLLFKIPLSLILLLAVFSSGFLVAQTQRFDLFNHINVISNSWMQTITSANKLVNTAADPKALAHANHGASKSHNSVTNHSTISRRDVATTVEQEVIHVMIFLVTSLFYFIPLLFIYGIIFGFTLVEGQRNKNKYGLDPKDH